MKTNFLKLAAESLIGFALLATSCQEKENTTPEDAPAFPEKVTETIAQGKSCEIKLSANKDWTLSMTGDLEYFTMSYNNEPATEISGRAGDFAVVVKAAEDETDFEQRMVTLTMTMEYAGKKVEQVVAEVHRNGKDRIFNVYPIKVEDGDFVYGENGYEFETEPATEFPLIFNGSNFLTYLQVKANYDWALKEVPEWVEINESGSYKASGKANETVVVSLRGVNSKFPDDDACEALKFIVNDDTAAPVEGEYNLSMKGVKEMFIMTPKEGAKFNKEGQVYNSMLGEYYDGVLKDSYYAYAGSEIYFLEDEDGYLNAIGDSRNKNSWIYADSFGPQNETDKLQEMSFSIKVKENTNMAARVAIVLIVPAHKKPANIAELIDRESWMSVAEAYQEYVYCTVTQEGTQGGAAGDDDMPISFKNVNYGGGEGCTLRKMSEAEDGENDYFMAVLGNGVPQDHVFELTLTPQSKMWGMGSTIAFNGCFAVPEDQNAFSFEGEAEDFYIYPEEGNCPSGSQVAFVCTNNMVPVLGIVVKYTTDSIGGDGLIALENEKDGALSKMDESNPAYEYLASEYGCTEIYDLTWKGNMIYCSTSFDYESIIVDEDSAEWLYCYAGGEGRIMLMGYAEFMSKGFVFFKDENGIVKAVLVCTVDPNFSAGGEGEETAATIKADNTALEALGAKFEKMKDNMNFSAFVDALNNSNISMASDDDYYVLTITNTETTTYTGFSYATELGQGVLYDFPTYDEDWEEWEFSRSKDTWATMSGDAITITWPDPDEYQKFIVVLLYNPDMETYMKKAVICVSRE